MGNLRDQLKKAKLIDAKNAKRLAHEERVHRAKVGGAKGVEEEREAHSRELAQQREATRRADAAREADRQAELGARAERAACEDLLARELRSPGRRGAGAWYFCLKDGRLPRLDLATAERMQLQEGLLCVVRRGPASTHDYGLLAVEHARRVNAALADRVVWAAPGALEPRS